MIEGKLKKEVINNWSNEFVDLSVYAQNKLYKICGPFILGLEISILSKKPEYRPTFVVYPLWKTSEILCLDEPIFMQEIYNKKNLQFNIPYEQHQVFFNDAVECTKTQFPILEYSQISLTQISEVINAQFCQILVKSSPVAQAKLLESKLFGALFLNDMITVQQILDEIKSVSISWAPNMFQWKFGHKDAWIQSLCTKVLNRDDFLKQIETNKYNKKILQLKNVSFSK